jgi:hypothetical protein
MLTLSQIERLLDAGHYGVLLDRVLANGRCHERELRQALRCPGVLAAAALGMALQRVCELSYGPSPLAARLADRLLDLQQVDGGFGPDRDTPAAARDAILASAIALRGLLDCTAQLGFFSPQVGGAAAVGSQRARVRSHGLQAGSRAPSDDAMPAPSRALAPSADVELGTRGSGTTLTAAIERTVGALAAMVGAQMDAIDRAHGCGTAAPESGEPASADGGIDAQAAVDALPLEVALWQLAPHRAATLRIDLPRAWRLLSAMDIGDHGGLADLHRLALAAA